MYFSNEIKKPISLVKHLKINITSHLLTPTFNGKMHFCLIYIAISLISLIWQRQR